MTIQYRRDIVVVGFALSLATVLSAAPTIGVASTRGTMEINNASVRGSANVPDGAAVQTNATTGQIQLDNGVRVALGQNSSATVFTSHLQLLQGAGQVWTKPGFGVEAMGFRVESATNASAARVAFDKKRILVTAVDRGLQVSQGGVLLARLTAGKTYFFEPDSGSDDSAASAGSKSGKGTQTGGTQAVKTGMSSAVKWGIVAGSTAAAGTGVGLGLYLSGNDASR